MAHIGHLFKGQLRENGLPLRKLALEEMCPGVHAAERTTVKAFLRWRRDGKEEVPGGKSFGLLEGGVAHGVAEYTHGAFGPFTARF